jgi:hypothetical protein
MQQRDRIKQSNEARKSERRSKSDEIRVKYGNNPRLLAHSARDKAIKRYFVFNLGLRPSTYTGLDE